METRIMNEKSTKPERKYVLQCPSGKNKLAYHEKVAIAAGLIKKLQKYDKEDFEVIIN